MPSHAIVRRQRRVGCAPGQAASATTYSGPSGRNNERRAAGAALHEVRSSSSIVEVIASANAPVSSPAPAQNA